MIRMTIEDLRTFAREDSLTPEALRVGLEEVTGMYQLPEALRRLILKGMRSQGAPMRLKDICAWVGPHATTYENPAILRVAVSIQLGLLVKARQVVRIQQGVYAPRQQKGNGTRQVEA